jgi:hypothetical protein
MQAGWTKRRVTPSIVQALDVSELLPAWYSYAAFQVQQRSSSMTRIREARWTELARCPPRSKLLPACTLISSCAVPEAA